MLSGDVFVVFLPPCAVSADMQSVAYLRGGGGIVTCFSLEGQSLKHEHELKA